MIYISYNQEVKSFNIKLNNFILKSKNYDFKFLKIIIFTYILIFNDFINWSVRKNMNNINFKI